jgi:tetratricopeptide (TPR) repeat protein
MPATRREYALAGEPLLTHAMWGRVRGPWTLTAVVALAAAVAGVVPGCRRESPAPARRDVAVATGIDLPSSAGDADRRVIETLRSAVAAPAGGGAPAPITVDYPEEGSIVPPDFAAPTFLWHDAAVAGGTAAAAPGGPGAVDAWYVGVELDGGARIDLLVPGGALPQGTIDPRCISERNEIYKPTPYQASAQSWKPDRAVWEAMKHASTARAVVTFAGYSKADPSRPRSVGRVSLVTSRDPVGAPIFYRDVPLMPSQTEEGVIKPLAKGALPLINWRLRDVGRDDSRLMLTDMPTCANCHSFSNDGRRLGMDIDGPQGDRGAYAFLPVAQHLSIAYGDVITWNAFPGKPKDFMTIGFLSRVSPDGQSVVSTVNEALYVQNFWNYRFNQVFYPTRGILAIYSAETRAITALTGADDPAYVHCNAVWSPDGQTIVFARAAARDAYPAGRPAATYSGDPNELPIQYDLYRIPFAGGRGGTPVPIEGASANGKSNSFPKISPDGRWLVYVQSRNGLLMRPDSRLFIVPLAGGAPREMHCNLKLMNSWHSFSPNGRWMVFSSKTNTPYTQMFLTHIDEEGNDSPALLIENATAANRAINLPEFVNVAYESFQGIEVPAVEHARLFNRGTDLATKGRHAEAVAAYQAALATEQNDWKTTEWRIRESLSKSLLALGRRDEALREIVESLRLNPYNPEMHTNLANLLFEAGDTTAALQHIDLAVRLMPKDARTWYNRATMRLKTGDRDGALADYGEAIRRDPTDPNAFYGRGMARADSGDRPGALTDFAEALRVAPPDWPHRAEAEARRLRLRSGAVGG